MWRPGDKKKKLVQPGRPSLILDAGETAKKDDAEMSPGDIMDFKKVAAWIGAGLVAAAGGAAANTASRADVESRLAVLEMRMDRLTGDTANMAADVKTLLTRSQPTQH